MIAKRLPPRGLAGAAFTQLYIEARALLGIFLIRFYAGFTALYKAWNQNGGLGNPTGA